MLSSVSSATAVGLDGSPPRETPFPLRLFQSLWTISFIGAVLRLVTLGRKSFWLDEIASVVIARTHGAVFRDFLWRHEGNMALYYLLLHPWLHFGYGEAMVRLISVIPGVLSIPFFYLLAARLFGRSTAILAAWLFALSSCDVVYSQEARGYSLLVLAVIVATYLLVRVIEQPTWGRAWAYGAAAGVMLYCHYFGALLLAAQAISLAALPAGRRPWKQLGLAAAVIVVLGAPVAWMVHIQDVAHIAWVPRPSWLELYHVFVFLAAESGKGVGAALLTLELVPIFIYLRKMPAQRRSPQLEFWGQALVASCAFSPIVLTLLVSLARPIFFHRFLIICLPGWLLMVAAGAEQIRRAGLRRSLNAAVIVLSLAATIVSYTHPREDWRGVAQYLIAQANPQDRVLYYSPVGYFATENYREWLPGGEAPRPQGVMVNPPSLDWIPKLDSAPRIWMVRYPATLDDATYRATVAELLKDYTAAGARQFRSIGVTEFQRIPQK